MTDPQLPITNVYAFPRLWDTICAAWGGEVFFADLADEIGGPVLELAVGTGRLLAEVARRGHKCAGLDLSPDMIDYCRKRLPKQQFVVGDMLEFDLGKKFRTIFIGNNSIQSLDSSEKWSRFLARVSYHLESGGEFALSMSNPREGAMKDSEGEPEIAQEFVDPETGVNTTIRSVFFYDPASLVGRTIWTNRAPDGTALLRYEFRLWYPTHEMVLGFLESAGFELVAAYGTHDRQPFGPDSRLQVCRFRKC
ncbi:MAG: class I SAM-dependent methyltransferase [Rhodobacteraceae bacterium]|nr:class I SAM-dependent methyltransferase [Paracoccaceae bacterium]